MQKNLFTVSRLRIDATHAGYAIFSGDVNQNGTIDCSDVSNADNYANNSLSGYVNTDVTEDDFVNAGDVNIFNSNEFISVSAVTP